MPYELSDANELTCATFKSRLNALLDARRLPQLDLPLAAHARRCPACEHLLSTQMRLLAALPSAPAEPSADFAVRVLQTVNVERQEQRRWRLRATTFVATAAAMLIAVVSWHGPVEQQMVVKQTGSQTPPFTAVLKRVDQVTTDIRPMTGSVYTAFNAFWLANRFL